MRRRTSADPAAARATAGETAAEAASPRGRQVLAVIGVWIGSAVVLALLGYRVTAAMVPADGQAPTLAAVLAVYLTLPVAAAVVFGLGGTRTRLAVRAASPASFGTGVLLWLVTLIAAAAVYLVFGSVTGAPSAPLTAVVHDATDYGRFPTATGLDWALIIPRALLLAGIAEELLFRGILYGWLRTHMAWWPTALITAALFALEHSFYPILVPFALLLGVALAWLRERTASLLPGLLVHILTAGLLFALALALP